MNVYETIVESAKKRPGRPAMVDPLGTLDYGALLEQIETVRLALLEQGLAPGQGVGVLGRDSRAFVISMFAALGCGAVVMPMSHEIPQEEIDGILQTVPLHAILDDRSTDPPVSGPSSCIEIPGTVPMRFTRTSVPPDQPFVPGIPDAAFVRPTSGTTGAPKGVILSHQGVLERTAAANRGLGISEDDKILWVLSMAFHFFVSIVLYLRYGATILLSEEDAESILDMAERHGATFLYASPLHIKRLADAPRERTLPPTLRRVVSTSTNLSVLEAQRFHDRFGIPVSQAYGIIEVGLPLFNLDRPLERPDSVGRPLPDYKVAILDENREPFGPGETGQLAIRGPGMLAGYLNPPEPDRPLFHDGWFLTGDMARQDADGYVTILGRAQSVIHINGHRIFPEQIEDVIQSHSKINFARVTNRPDPDSGVSVLHADVVLMNPLWSHPDKDDVIAHCRAHLPPEKVPQSVRFRERIEQTRSGKITRHPDQE